jgi:hypothetical protein
MMCFHHFPATKKSLKLKIGEVGSRWINKAKEP